MTLTQELAQALRRMDECRAGCDIGEPFYADSAAWDLIRASFAEPPTSRGSEGEVKPVACKACGNDPERQADLEPAIAQAVEFAEYVSEHAKGRMVERAQHFLSLKYAQELAGRISK